MKVFISWSGTRSKSLANALRDWLPLVLQYVEPFVSDKDICAGERWAQKIAGELETSNFGIICITPENVTSPWILFEAGALSKSMLDAKVIPLLFNLELSDLSGPLSQFQAQKVEESGLMEVVKAINHVADKKAADAIISQLVPTLWPKLQEALGTIPNKEPSERHMRPQHEILEELVTGVRGLNTRMRDFDPEIMARDLRERKRRFRIFDPMMLDEIIHASGECEESPLSLLIIGGYLRNDFPWLSEIFIKSYREIRNSDSVDAEQILLRLHRVVRSLTRGPFLEEMAGGSKDTYRLVRDLPMLIDRAIRPMIKTANNPEKASAEN